MKATVYCCLFFIFSIQEKIVFRSTKYIVKICLLKYVDT